MLKRNISTWLSLRLSAQLPVGVCEGNPNIVNLNDPYRSTKVAELYSELYDNEWTTAYDRIEKDKPDGRYIIDTLLDILIVIFYMEHCQELQLMWYFILMHMYY